MAKAPEESNKATSPKKKSGMMTLIKAIAFVSVIVLLEIAAASMLLPDAETTRTVSKQLASAEVGENGEPLVDEGASQQLLNQEDTREVSLGEPYHVLTFDPETGSSMTVDFELYGIVLADEESQFYELYTGNEQRIREQVNITMRAMEASDFADPGLGLIRRRILEKVNRSLGSPLLQRIVFPKFMYMER